ncbi:MAG: hypothetical protein K0S56_2114 [Microvirga sp.]|jgi:hypothetical protein|nr:hypothetical protein [Microvirga sp.]
MPVTKTKSGFHISSTERSILTPESVEATGIYLEGAGRAEIWLHYAGDDAIKEGHPGLRLPREPKFLRELAGTLTKLAEEESDRRNGR